MTLFAQLGLDAGLEKQAMPGGAFWGKAHRLVRNGFWKTVARKTTPGAPGWRGGLNRASRAFHNPNVGKIGTDGLQEGKSTMLSTGASIYGFGGLGASALGYDLPGSDLALNITTPGLGALFTAPNLISSARMTRPANQAKLLEDTQAGAREAVGDMMSVAQSDPRYASKADLYRQFMNQYSPESSALADRYSKGNVAPMSNFNKVRSAFSDSQALINDQIDQKIPEMMNKIGSVEKSGMLAALKNGAKAVGTGAGHALPWLFGAGGLAGVGSAIMSDKPYDEVAVRQRGYAAAQAALQKKIQNMNGFERMALQFDPSIIGQQAEKVLPGTISQWEGRSGQKYQPGLIAKTMDSWSKGGDHSYYEYDAAGQRKYI